MSIHATLFAEADDRPVVVVHDSGTVVVRLVNLGSLHLSTFNLTVAQRAVYLRALAHAATLTADQIAVKHGLIEAGG